jgi:hypothetical protein
MSEEKAKSAIDEIFSIAEKLDRIEKHLIVIDNNVKLLNNKISKLSKKNDESLAGPSAAAPKALRGPSAAAAVVQNTDPEMVVARSKELIIGDIKLFGYIYNKNQMPIKGVSIVIYDNDGDIIKEKVSNNDGYWSVRLPSGKYGVEYNHQFGKRKFKPINRTVELSDTTKEYEVT